MEEEEEEGEEVSDAAVLDAPRPIPHHPSSLDLLCAQKAKARIR